VGEALAWRQQDLLGLALHEVVPVLARLERDWGLARALILLGTGGSFARLFEKSTDDVGDDPALQASAQPQTPWGFLPWRCLLAQERHLRVGWPPGAWAVVCDQRGAGIMRAG